MARRGWSKGSLVMGAFGRNTSELRSDAQGGALCHLRGGRSLTGAALIGVHGRKPSRDRQGACALPSLPPRDGPFQSGDEVQFRRGVSEDFLIAAIERIAQIAVSGHAAAKGVIQVDAGVGESGIPE